MVVGRLFFSLSLRSLTQDEYTDYKPRQRSGQKLGYTSLSFEWHIKLKRCLRNSQSITKCTRNQEKRCDRGERESVEKDRNIGDTRESQGTREGRMSEEGKGEDEWGEGRKKCKRRRRE